MPSDQTTLFFQDIRLSGTLVLDLLFYGRCYGKAVYQNNQFLVRERIQFLSQGFLGQGQDRSPICIVYIAKCRKHTHMRRFRIELACNRQRLTRLNLHIRTLNDIGINHAGGRVEKFEKIQGLKRVSTSQMEYRNLDR